MLIVILHFLLLKAGLLSLLLEHTDLIFEIGSLVAHLLLELFDQVAVTFLSSTGFFPHALVQTCLLLIIEGFELVDSIFTGSVDL